MSFTRAREHVRQIGRRIGARNTLHAKLHPPIYAIIAAAAAEVIDAARASRRRAVATDDAAKLSADDGGKRRIPLGLAHLEVNVGICDSEGDGDDLASALRDEAPFARMYPWCVVGGKCKVEGRGGG